MFFFSQPLKHHEMARYDLSTYMLRVLGYFWMFTEKTTDWLFSLKKLGTLESPTHRVGQSPK